MLRQLQVLALLVTVAAEIPWRDASAQSPSRPSVGQRVRVQLAAGRAPIEGTVVGWAADTRSGGARHSRSHRPVIAHGPGPWRLCSRSLADAGDTQATDLRVARPSYVVISLDTHRGSAADR
jgi:hypothetical protein